MQPCSEIASQPGSTLNFSNARFLSDSIDDPEISVSNILQVIYTHSHEDSIDSREASQETARKAASNYHHSLSPVPIPFDEFSPVKCSKSMSRHSGFYKKKKVITYNNSNQLKVPENEFISLHHTGRLISEGSDVPPEVFRLVNCVNFKPGDRVRAVVRQKQVPAKALENILAGLDLDGPNENSMSHSQNNCISNGQDNEVPQTENTENNSLFED